MGRQRKIRGEKPEDPSVSRSKTGGKLSFGGQTRHRAGLVSSNRVKKRCVGVDQTISVRGSFEQIAVKGGKRYKKVVESVGM